MKKLILIAALVLGGCASEAEKAEEEYRLMRSSFVSLDEQCAAERKIQQAYLRSGEKRKYQEWRFSAGLICNKAAMQRR